MEKLTEKKVIQIHAFLIEEMGGEPSIRDPATLSFIVDAINYEPDLFRKAAQALFLADRHPFWDGQKRTRTTDLLVYLLDGPNELIADEVLCFEYNKWAKILEVHDLFNFLARRVIINNPTEGELSKCTPFFETDMPEPPNLPVIINFADMIHAATCLGTDAILITEDKHFNKIKKSKLIEVWSKAEAIRRLSPPINPP